MSSALRAVFALFGMGIVVAQGSGCSSPLNAFECRDDSECVSSSDGRCVLPQNRCAYPNQECRGGFEFGDNAGELAGECVSGDDENIDGGIDPNITDAGSGSDAEVENSSPIIRIAAEGNQTCALATDRVICWGNNDSAQHNSSDSEPAFRSKQGSYTKIALGEQFRCLGNGSDIVCTGSNTRGQLGSANITLDEVVHKVEHDSIHAGSQHFCVVDDGRVACTGDNVHSQASLAEPPTLTELTPTPIAGDRFFSAGEQHSCWIDRDNALFCSGNNRFGQLAKDAEKTSTINHGPTLVGTSPIQSLRSGPTHNCLIDGQNELYCWGNNNRAQSAGEVLAPVVEEAFQIETAQGSAFHAVAPGRSHTCAIHANAQIACWGTNDRYQCGESEAANVQVAPFLFSIDSEVRPSQIVAGNDHSCVLLPEVGVYCWGYNSDGQVSPELLDLGALRPVLVLPDPVPETFP